MNIFIILSGFAGFFVFMGVHIFIWRWLHPKRDYLLLFIISFMIFLSYFIIIYLVSLKKYAFIDWILVFFLYFILCGTYIASYPAVQAISPSLKIVLLAGQAMPNGAAIERIKSNFDSRELLDLKIQDLVRSKLIAEKNGVLNLTKKGSMMIIAFMFLRKVLGLSTGRG